MKLSVDTHPRNQPDGTYRFALNAAFLQSEKDKISSEPGTETCFSITSGYTVLGHVVAGNDIILFSTNGTNSEIGSVSDCTYTVLVNSSCLTFSEPIQAVYTIRNGCDKLVYWCDGVNPDRYINLAKLEDFYSDSFASHLAAGNPAGTFVGERWNCNLFSLTPEIQIPEVRLSKVYNSGGNLRLGAYYFAFKYKDLPDFVSIAGPIFITNEDISSTAFTNIDGGFNIDPIPEAIGGLTPTSKSIELAITNLEQSQNKLEVVVIEGTTGDGITRKAFKVAELDISANDKTWVYTGLPDGAVPVDIEDVVINNPKYITSNTLALAEDRLIRAAVSEPQEDYCTLQRIANEVQVRFFTASVDSEFSSPAGPAFRDPHITMDYRTWMRDEVYAFGIQFIDKYGKLSSVYHIPGRQKNKNPSGSTLSTTDPDTHNRPSVASADTPAGWDDSLYLLSGTYANDLEHIDDDAERWQAYNTAILLGANAGTLGYYECQDEYPDIRDCNNVPIYPYTDLGSGNYQMHNIRHHRMPDETLVPLYGSNQVYTTITLTFSNVIIPSNLDIVAYRIVYSKRNQANKTVLDKGLAERTLDGLAYFPGWLDNPTGTVEPVITQSFIYNQRFDGTNQYPMAFTRAGVNKGIDLTAFTEERDKYQSLYTPKILFDEKAISADYLKIEGRYTGEIRHHNNDLLRENMWDLMSDERWWTSSVELLSRAGNPQAGLTNRIINGDPASLEMEQLISGTRKFRSYKNQFNVIYNTELPYPTADNDIITGGTTNSDGYANNTTTTYYYVSLKQYLTNAYADLANIEYMPISDIWTPFATTNITYTGGGDVYISRMDVRKTYSVSDRVFNLKNTVLRGKNFLATLAGSVVQALPFGIFFRANQTLERTVHTHITFVTESEYNAYYRNEGIEMERDHKDQGSANTDDDNVTNSRVYYPKSYSTAISNFLLLPTYFLNWFSYNKDFSMLRDIAIQRSFGNTIDCCEECYLDNRIVWSEPQLNESAYTFNTVLANNYVDVPADKGKIVAIHVFQNNLLVRAGHTIWQIPFNRQELEVGPQSLYIGNGSFLGIKPIPILDIPYSYAGSQEKFNFVNTEEGLFFTANRQVFRFYDKLESISDYGMSEFFNTELPYRFDTSYVHFGEVGNENQVSTILGYDPELKRVILHKKDYTVIDQDEYENQIDTGNYDLLDPDVYAKNSFTLSYYPSRQGWVSFHSYMPVYMMNDRDWLYSTKDGNIFVKHGRKNHCSFYDIDFPHMVELVVKDTNEFNTNSVVWLGRFYIYDSNVNKWKPIQITYNKLWAYNENQATSVILNKVSPYGTLAWSNTEKSVKLADNLWRVGQIRDLYKTDELMFTEDPASTEIQDYHIGSQGFIDKEFDSAALETTRSQYYQPTLKNRYVQLRFIFDKSIDNLVGNYKATLDVADTLKQYSFR